MPDFLRPAVYPVLLTCIVGSLWMLAASVNSDDGGGDIITTSGAIPVTLNLSGGDSITVNSGNVILNF